MCVCVCACLCSVCFVVLLKEFHDVVLSAGEYVVIKLHARLAGTYRHRRRSSPMAVRKSQSSLPSQLERASVAARAEGCGSKLGNRKGSGKEINCQRELEGGEQDEEKEGLKKRETNKGTNNKVRANRQRTSHIREVRVKDTFEEQRSEEKEDEEGESRETGKRRIVPLVGSKSSKSTRKSVGGGIPNTTLFKGKLLHNTVVDAYYAHQPVTLPGHVGGKFSFVMVKTPSSSSSSSFGGTTDHAKAHSSHAGIGCRAGSDRSSEAQLAIRKKVYGGSDDDEGQKTALSIASRQSLRALKALTSLFTGEAPSLNVALTYVSLHWRDLIARLLGHDDHSNGGGGLGLLPRNFYL